MKLNFDKNTSGKKVSSLSVGDYQKMVDMRKERLSDFQETIQGLMDNYEGQNMAILIVKEDENGLPIGTRELLLGVGRMESEIELSKALHKTSKDAIDLLFEQVDGNSEATKHLVKLLLEVLNEEEE
jgi:hypothetical protein